MDKKKKEFAIAAIRRATYRWPGRYMAEKRSRIDRGLYFCENPDCGVIGKKKEFQMDHTLPIVDPVEGFVGFDSYIDRALAYEDGWRRLCITCHKTKSAGENEIRKQNKKKKD